MEFLLKNLGNNKISNYLLIDNDELILEIKEKLALLKDEFQGIIITKTMRLVRSTNTKKSKELASTKGISKNIAFKG